MVLQRFLVLHDVENYIQKVYQNSPIRKLKFLEMKKEGLPENRSSGQEYAQQHHCFMLKAREIPSSQKVIYAAEVYIYFYAYGDVQPSLNFLAE